MKPEMASIAALLNARADADHGPHDGADIAMERKRSS